MYGTEVEKSVLDYLGRKTDGDKLVLGKGVLAGLNDRLSAFVPEKGKVLCVLDGRFAAAETVYGIVTRKFRAERSPEGLCASRKYAQGIKISEDVKAVVCAGGGGAADVAKYVAARKGLPAVVVALSQATAGYMSPSSMLEADGGYTEVYKTGSPALTVMDTALLKNDDELNAAGFGEICSRLASLFDWELSHILCGEDYSADVAADAVKLIKYVLTEAEHDALNAEKTGICAALMSAVTERCKSSRMMCGGEAQMAHAFKLLKRKSGGKVRLQGENEMIFSVVTMRAYVAALSLIGAPVSAPDNNVRLERMVRALGMSPFRAADKLTAGMPPAELNRYIHILREYRAELMFKAEIYEKTLSFALKRFKRLYKDKGYSYNNYLDADSLKLCFALAPEMREKFTFFTLLKQTGMLEGFL